MEKVDSLLKQIIFKRTGFSELEYEHKQNFKKCKAFLRQYHPLEINPKFVTGEMNQICEKLEIHSLDYKSVALTNMFNKLLQSCNYSIDPDQYLMMYGIILFLIELNGAMVNSYEHEEIVEKNEKLENEKVNWVDILTKSEDIVNLTRQDYELDDISSNYSSEFEDEPEKDQKSVNTSEETNEIIDYSLIKSESWNYNELISSCSSSLQSEYWLHSFETKHISTSLKCNKQSRNFSVFIDDWEHFTAHTNPTYFYREIQNRIEISEYQLVRELLDVLSGADSSLALKVEYDQTLILLNRYKVSNAVKLISMSWQCLDSLIAQIAELATLALQLRLVCSFITRNNCLVDLPASIVALGDRIHNALHEFQLEVLSLETRARDSGDSALLLEMLIRCCHESWFFRLRFIVEVVVCATVGRFESLTCPTAVIALLNLLYKLTNENSRLILGDPWISQCSLDLFFHVFRPYLYSLDSLLCGQLEFCKDNFVFLTKKSNVQSNRPHTSISELNLNMSRNDQLNLKEYWTHNFSLVGNTNLGGREWLLREVPVVLHGLVVELISTVKAIDLLRLLSIELTKPSLFAEIIVEPGRLIDQYWDSAPSSVPLNGFLYEFRFVRDFHNDQYPEQLGLLSDELEKQLCIECPAPDTERIRVSNCGNELPEWQRRLSSGILDRYRAVNRHLIACFSSTLGLRRALSAIRSVLFFQAGVELHEFCEYVFDGVLAGALSLDTIRRKLFQLLEGSLDPELAAEASRFRVNFVSGMKNSEDQAQDDLVMGDGRVVLPSIAIDYQADWALGLVMNSLEEQGGFLDISNRCFRFLLRLRFAEYCIGTRIHTERQLNHDWSLVARRLCALRLKLLQIVNCFHVYVMNSFIVPSWNTILNRIDHPYTDENGSHVDDDFTDFLARIREPFDTMARGCLQSEEMESIEKAIKSVVLLGLETATLSDEHAAEFVRVRRLEDRYKHLIEFLSAMFRSLAHLGVSISELDMSAFR